MLKIAIVSAKGFQHRSDNVFLSESLLELGGVNVSVVDWADPSVSWNAFDAVVIRTTWNYHAQRGDFVKWAASVPRLFNSPRTITWNTDKKYLLDLERAGVPIVPTEFVTAGNPARATLLSIATGRGWAGRGVVVKPCVSAGADDTFLVPGSETGDQKHQHSFAQLASARDVMVQPFCSSVKSYGEVSLLFARGEMTHAARKRPANGDRSFQVQEHLGGTTVLEPNPDPRAIALAQATLRVAADITGEVPLYCRVDCFLNDEGSGFMVSELEATEPSFYHDLFPQSARILAAKIKEVALSSPSSSR